jgi:polysaccharide deacetylase 2 family uncharacterized protein YibQ
LKIPKLPNLSGFFSKNVASDVSDDDSDEGSKVSSEKIVEDGEVDDGMDISDSGDEDGNLDSGNNEDGDVEADGNMDFGDDSDNDDSSRSSRSMVIAIVVSSIFFACILAGVGWYYFSDDKSDGVTKGSVEKTASTKQKGPMVSLAIPPRRKKDSVKGGLNQFLGAPSKLSKQGGGKGGLNQLAGSQFKGVITPSVTSVTSGTAVGQVSPIKLQKAKGTSKPVPSGNVAGRRVLSSDARAVGIIGGRFGGRADPLGGALNAIGGQAEVKGAGMVIPSVTSVTLNSLPDNPGGKPLRPTPDNKLIEKKEGLSGFLPKAGKGDEVSWKVYARPYVGEEQGKRVAIVVMGLGLSKASSMAAIKKLPPEVSLALDPYATGLSDWLVRARLVGHEVLLTLPMESEEFPVQDAGPYALKTSLNEEDNVKRLEDILSQVTGYFGVATVLGSRFGDSKALMTVVLNNLKDRGLMLLTTGSQNSLLAPKIARKIGLPLVIGDVTLDAEPSPAGVQAKLLRLESILKDKGIAVAIAQPYPTTLRRLIAWTKTLEGKKITLVPVSALINKQFTIKKPEK